jgi:hypothetical protein
MGKKTANERWEEQSQYVKLGSKPAFVVLDQSQEKAIGKSIRYQERVGEQWKNGLVINVDPIKIAR